MNTVIQEPSAKYLLARDSYRQTDVGLIPQDWSVNEMRQIGSLSKGRGLLKEDIETSGSVPAIPYTALYTDFSEVVDYARIKWFVDDIAGTIVVNEPCVLIASSSNMAANTGKATALPGTLPVAIGREVIIFRTNHSAVFFSYLLSTASYRKRTLVLARGTTIKHLYPATFESYRVAVPPPAEQLAITDALGDVDALIAGLERLIAKKRDIKQATMQQLLTGQTRLPGFSGEWRSIRLADLTKIEKGQIMTTDLLIPGDVPVIAGGKQPAYFHAVANREGMTITVSASGASAGYVAFHKKPIFASDCSTISEHKNYSIEFLFFSLLNKQKVIYGLQTGGAQPHVQPKDLAPLLVPMPPNIQEQTAIAAVLSDMDADLSALEARLAKTRAIKQGMMQELLTGRTRLV